MSDKLSIPLSIVVAGLLIGGGFYLRGSSKNNYNPIKEGIEQSAGMRPVDASDHVLGNPEARLILVEYSDPECPFCKNFHSTMRQLMSEYGQGGSLSWVYRHFPLAQLHPNAPRLAEASECVAELAGEDAFWSFLDEVFALAPVNTLFPMDRLTDTAVKVGANRTAFESCLNSGRYQSVVEAEFNDAIASGGQGTPHNIILAAGQVIPVPGAQPYNQMKTIIEAILAETGSEIN